VIPMAIKAAHSNPRLTLPASRRSNTSATNMPTIDQIVGMKDDIKLVTAFLVLNFSVVALAIAGYQKSGMRLGAVFSHLTS
jgi:hypothetical protein